MPNQSQNLVFLVGLGAPESLYSDYLADLKKHLPKSKFAVLEWWSQADFGQNELQTFMSNSNVTLIAHSAGGVIALQALAKWPDLVNKIIMLDSHFLRTANVFLKVSQVLEIMLRKDNSALKHRVKQAYSPIIANDDAFQKALQFAIQWVNEHFDEACMKLKSMPSHSALQIGFTNPSYDLLDAEGEASLLAVWDKLNVDVRFHPMGHFDLIDEKNADSVNQIIIEWFRL